MDKEEEGPPPEYNIYDYPSEEEERLPSISPRPIYEGDC